jgi:uncharacterized protein
MYLLDSNLFLELLLDQQKADEVEQLLRRTARERLHLSEFSVYSVGIVLFRHRLLGVFAQFLDELVLKGGVRVLRLSLQDIWRLPALAQRYNLDFDDAYQYGVAEKYGLEIVSFDGDFDRTQKGRKTPAQIGV